MAASLLLVFQVGSAHAFELRSSAFAANASIPAVHTCDGADRSPPLGWTDPPKGTQRLALVCEDPDAPAGTWTHWIVYDLPATTRELPEGVPPAETIAGGGKQAANDFKRAGWGGPCPPRGPAHRYVFRLYALDGGVTLPAHPTRTALVAAFTGHTLARAELTGRYARQESR